MKIKLTIIILSFCATTLFGQFSVEKYLSAPFNSAEVEGLLKQMEYLDNESFRSPLFRELEIRLRSNDFNLSPEDYRLRLGFINPFERRANKSFNEKQAEYFNTKYDYEANLILANRYKQLITHYFFKFEKINLDNEILRLELGYEQSQNTDFDIKLLVETDEKILKKELDRKKIQTSLSILENYIRETHNIQDTINWVNFTMISVAKIREKARFDTLSNSSEFLLALKSFQMDEQEYKIKKAESYRNIGFFQAEYDIDRGKEFNNHMGFQLGISLPVFNPDKPDLQRRKLDLLESEYELNELKDEAGIERFNLNEKLLELIWNYEVVEKRLKDFEYIGKDITYDNIEDYLALISYLSNLRSLKNEIHKECLSTYIDLLALSGKLSAPPYVNYISIDQAPFTIGNN